MVFKLPKPKRRVNEKMTLEALHKSAETYREMYDDIRKKNDILQKQLDIAVKALKQYTECKPIAWGDDTISAPRIVEYYHDDGKVAREALHDIKELNK